MSIAPSGDYLLIIDASSFIHRAFHALPRLKRRSDDLPTGALHGFCWTMLKQTRLNYTPIGRLPTHCVVVCDTRGKNFRHEIYPEYKANRSSYDIELEQQLPWIPTIAEAFGLPCIGMAGWEADDIIATYCAKAEMSGLNVVVASSDKDLCQLVYGGEPSVIMYDAMKDKGRDNNDGALIGPHEVREKFGVSPMQMIDYQAMVGDTVDNVPGIPSIGPKSAARLLQEFGTLDAIFEEASWDDSRFKPKEHAALLKYRDQALLSRELVSLSTEVPVEVDVEDLRVSHVRSHQIRALLIDLEFMSLIEAVDRIPR